MSESDLRDANLRAEKLQAQRDTAVRLLREAGPLLREYADSVGCDHSVGVCACGVRRAADETRAFLENL